jgi:hypothetical protein
MRAIIRGAVLAAALGLTACGMGGCQSFGQFVKDSDNNPNCYRDIAGKFATVFIFAWPVPILTEGSYRKVCNKHMAPGAEPAQPSLIRPGAVVGAPVGG